MVGKICGGKKKNKKKKNRWVVRRSEKGSLARPRSVRKTAFLRHTKYGISAHISRHLTFTAILPRMLWESPVWWLNTPGTLEPLTVAYYSMVRWVTGLPKNTRTENLLRCAYLPLLHAFLDYLSRRYAVRTLFLPDSHILFSSPTPIPNAEILPGVYRIRTFTHDMAHFRLENRQNT
jgi:hypothetical protein